MSKEFLKKLQDKLYYACENNHLHIVKHMLESEKIKKNIDLQANYGKVLTIACEELNEELLDYLLTFKELSNSNCSFKAINKCFGNACYRNKIELLHFIYE